MQPPFAGSWIVRVDAVRPFTIHSDIYYELQIVRAEAPDQPMLIRAPQHAFAAAPRAGERYEVSFLMGQVTGAKIMDASR